LLFNGPIFCLSNRPTSGEVINMVYLKKIVYYYNRFQFRMNEQIESQSSLFADMIKKTVNIIELRSYVLVHVQLFAIA